MPVSSHKSGSQSPVLLLDSAEGLSNYTCYLARGISKFRKVVVYCFSENSHILTGSSLEKNVRFHYFKKWLPKGYSTLKGIIRVIILFFILLVALTRTEYSIVHIQEHLPMFFFFIPLLKLQRKKIFWTLHDTEIFSPSRDIHGSLQVLFLKIFSQPNILTKYSDGIIVHALSLKQQLIEKKVDENKIHVIPHFDYNYLLEKKTINLTSFDSKSTSFKNQDLLPKKYALFLGNIAPWKGLEVLIEATKIVSNKLEQKFNVVIAGAPYDGYHSYFNNLIKNKDDNITIINRFIESYEIPSIIDGSSFLILPYIDTFQNSVSGVIPLAYTFSKPVIVSSIKTLEEYVDHNKSGFIFKAGDSTQLASYMIELLEDDVKCAEMGSNARQKMIQEMSLKRCCETLNAIYNEQ